MHGFGRRGAERVFRDNANANAKILHLRLGLSSSLAESLNLAKILASFMCNLVIKFQYRVNLGRFVSIQRDKNN